MAYDLEDIDAIIEACDARERKFCNVYSEDYLEREDQRAFGAMVKHVFEDFTECAPHRLLSGLPGVVELRDVVRHLQDHVRSTMLACWRNRFETPE
jgi:hypothetical protein